MYYFIIIYFSIIYYYLLYVYFYLYVYMCIAIYVCLCICMFLLIFMLIFLMFYCKIHDFSRFSWMLWNCLLVDPVYESSSRASLCRRSHAKLWTFKLFSTPGQAELQELILERLPGQGWKRGWKSTVWRGIACNPLPGRSSHRQDPPEGRSTAF